MYLYLGFKYFSYSCNYIGLAAKLLIGVLLHTSYLKKNLS